LTEAYYEKIASNQHKISNHNCSDDYVNILLNDIGEKNYYEPQNIGDGTGFSKILETHCANQYFKFGEDGSFTTVRAEQSWETKELDQFLNSYLRSISRGKRAVALATVGALMEEAFRGSRNLRTYVDLLINGRNLDETAYLLAYLVKYEQECPELGAAIHSICSRYGVEQMGLVDFVLDFNDGLDCLEEVRLKFGTDELVDIADFAIDVTGCLPSCLNENLKEELNAWLKNKGLLEGRELSEFELRRLLSIISLINADLEEIKIEKNGYDVTVESAPKASLLNPYEEGALWRRMAGVGGIARQFSINCEVMDAVCDELSGMVRKIDGVIGALDASASRLASQESEPLNSVGRSVREMARSVEVDKKNAETLLVSLRRIVEMYRSCEMRITWANI